MRSAILLIVALLSFSGISIAQGDKPQLKPDPNRIADAKEQNARALKINALINQYAVAAAAKDWQGAADAAAQMVALEPRYDFYASLGNAQYNLAKYSDAIASFELAVDKAGKWDDLRTAAIDKRTIVGRALAYEGNAYLKLKKNDDAIRSYSRAAEIDPNPGLAFFNLCATNYNMGNMEAAAAACDRSIAADPARADAYFIKGSSLFGLGKLDANNKYVLPPGTKEALRKYLELAPNGPHAADVKAMLDANP